MRAVLALALLALAAAPAAAQDLPRVEVRLAEVDAPVPPLAGFVTVPGEVVVPCAFLAGTAPVPVDVAVVAAPPWTQASVTPGTLYANGVECTPPAAVLPFDLLLSATAEAPAFTPAEVEVEAVARAATGDQRGAATTFVSADYFCILDVVVEPSIRRAPEGRAATFALAVANHGNAATRVAFAVEDAPEGWQVQVPVPVSLESKQQGGTTTSATVDVVVVPHGRLSPGVVQLRTTGAYAVDAATTCRDAVATTMLVELEERFLPAAGAVVALAVAGALARRA